MATLSSLGVVVLIAVSTLFFVILVVFILWLLHINGRLCSKTKLPHENLPPPSFNVHMAGFQHQQDDPRSSSASTMSERVLSALGVRTDKHRGHGRRNNNHTEAGVRNVKGNTGKQLDENVSGLQTFKRNMTSSNNIIASAPIADDEDDGNVYDEADDVIRVPTNRHVVHNDVETSCNDNDSNIYVEVIRDSVLQEGDVTDNIDNKTNQDKAGDDPSSTRGVYVELERISDDERIEDGHVEDDKFEYSLASDVHPSTEADENCMANSVSAVVRPNKRCENVEKSGSEAEVFQIDEQDYFVLEQINKPVETDVDDDVDVDDYEEVNEVTSDREYFVLENVNPQTVPDTLQENVNVDDITEIKSEKNDDSRIRQNVGAKSLTSGNIKDISLNTQVDEMVTKRDMNSETNVKYHDDFLTVKVDNVVTDMSPTGRPCDVIRMGDDDVSTTLSADLSPTLSEDYVANDDVMFAYNIGV